jgi:hypothetical protein
MRRDRGPRRAIGGCGRLLRVAQRFAATFL